MIELILEGADGEWGLDNSFSPDSVCLSVQCYQKKISTDTAMLLLPPPYVLHQVQDTVKVD